MSEEMSFEEWYEKFKAIRVERGLAPIDDVEIAELMHLEGLTPEQAVAET